VDACGCSLRINRSSSGQDNTVRADRQSVERSIYSHAGPVKTRETIEAVRSSNGWDELKKN